VIEKTDLVSTTQIESDGQFRVVRRSPSNARERAPLLSIVICAYRHEAFIEDCLKSVDLANGVDLELIVVDDGSPDDTLKKCLAYPFRDNLRFTILTKPNGGLIQSLRLGLSLASGHYIAFMASDDLYLPEGLMAIQKLLSLRDESPDAILCQARYLDGAMDGKPVYTEKMEAFFRCSVADRVERICTEFPTPMLLQAAVFNTYFLRSLTPWQDGLELDDWPTFIRVFMAEAELAAKIMYVPAIELCRYRLHDGGVHNRIDRLARVTEQVARQLVPERFRAVCLANVFVDAGFIHLYRGHWIKGCSYWLKGISTAPTYPVVARLAKRVLRKVGLAK